MRPGRARPGDSRGRPGKRNPAQRFNEAGARAPRRSGSFLQGEIRVGELQ